MNHDEASQLMIAEKYLLNELSPEVREQFEEHFFTCSECADDLHAGVIFIEQSKAILSSERTNREGELAASRTQRRGWLDWLFRPAFAIPVMALLLAAIGYLAMAPRSKPQVLSAVFINVGSRGGNTPSVTVDGQESFLLRVSVPPDHDYSSYFVNVYGPAGQLEWPLKLPTATEDDSYFVQIPSGRHEEGTYTVAVQGITSTGVRSEVGRSTFVLHIRQ